MLGNISKSSKGHVGDSEIDSPGVRREHPWGALMRDSLWRGLQLDSVLAGLRQNAAVPTEVAETALFPGLSTREDEGMKHCTEAQLKDFSNT